MSFLIAELNCEDFDEKISCLDDDLIKESIWSVTVCSFSFILKFIDDRLRCLDEDLISELICSNNELNCTKFDDGLRWYGDELVMKSVSLSTVLRFISELECGDIDFCFNDERGTESVVIGSSDKAGLNCAGVDDDKCLLDDKFVIKSLSLFIVSPFSVDIDVNICCINDELDIEYISFVIFRSVVNFSVTDDCLRCRDDAFDSEYVCLVIRSVLVERNCTGNNGPCCLEDVPTKESKCRDAEDRICFVEISVYLVTTSCSVMLLRGIIDEVAGCLEDGFVVECL